MPVIKTKGAASSQGFGEFAKSAAVPNYIEDVFSTWLYTGNGSSQTITNGIDLSTKGGLVWIKSRTLATAHYFQDTARGANNYISSNSTNANTNLAALNTVFNNNGFSQNNNYAGFNDPAYIYASWTFRKQPKFFDVVTFTTAAGGADTVVSHSLGSTPGCIIIKNTQAADNWLVYHRGLPSLFYKLFLNSTGAQTGGTASGGAITALSSTTFTANGNQLASSNTHVAYVFAHDAGGFGLTGTDNVISCGSFTCDGSGTASVTLGYEPQWIMFKKTSSTGNWWMFDNMRGLPTYNSSSDQVLYANLTDAETSGGATASISATGFAGLGLGASSTYIYIAIRRGPMKVPTTGTSVYNAVPYSGDNTNPRLLDFSLNLDAALFHKRNSATDASNQFGNRLAGSVSMPTNATDVESPFYINNWASNVGIAVKGDGQINGNTYTYIGWGLRRAPSFMDVVCYTGTGANATWTHNLGVAPEMMIVKKRSAAANWAVYHSALTAAGYAILNTTAASSTASTFWQSTAPTSTSFYTGTNGNVGDSGATYVAYLFATVAGVSKVGSYTGNGTTQTINCGFAGGARFVLIKRTDSTGDWYVYDTARGMTTLTDPYLLLNSTAAESATLGSVTTVTTGFAVNASILAAINTNAATYIFLAIA